MMVKKRVSTRKTENGYSIHVFVNDGETARALRLGIDRFFEKLEAQRHPESQSKLSLEADKYMEDLKNATPVA